MWGNGHCMFLLFFVMLEIVMYITYADIYRYQTVDSTGLCSCVVLHVLEGLEHKNMQLQQF